MKYNITTLQKEVPENIRLEIYKEALHRMETNPDYKNRGLCITLPFILFNLESCFDDYTDTITRQIWFFKDTPKAFPELTQRVLASIEVAYDFKPRKRKALLGEWIEQLENRITKTE